MRGNIMNKNYYEILEVSRSASPEIIEKAYKILVKKYHPDLQPDNLKATYSEKLKLINEAYNVLSNPEKRSEYDNRLRQDNINEYISRNYNNNPQTRNDSINNTQSDINYRTTQNNNTYNTANSNQNKYQNNQNSQNNVNQQQYYQEEYRKKMNEAVQKAYHDAYIQDLKNRGYKIKYKKSIKDRLKDLIALSISLLVLFLLFQIPFIKNSFMSFPPFRAIIDLIVSFFN